MIRALVASSLLVAQTAAADVQLSPQNREDLEGLLQKLAQDHRQPAWCPADCVSFFEVKVTGRLDSGGLDVAVSGFVHGDTRAYVELFGTKPAVELDALTTAGGGRQPLFWSGRAYATVLPPGAFVLRGRLGFAKGSALTLSLPGPVGQVTLDVADADVVGTGERRGVREATYQLAPRTTVAENKDGAARLRLSVDRRFSLARDKTFSVTLTARGARPGQVVSVPLMAGEHVEDLDRSVAHERTTPGGRTLDWVASGREASLTYAGRWTADRIELTAAGGAVKETWAVRCDDPFLCSMSGDAEVQPGAVGHLWAPMPGQKLVVTWEELVPMEGVHTVAQRVLVASRPVGRNLQQQLVINWMSSSGSLVGLGLPEGAVVSSFLLEGVATPVLKDDKGLVHLNLPAGRSQLKARWEIAGAGGRVLSPPVPTLHAPVGTLYHSVFPPEATAVLLAGGLAGSPRVVFWPSLATCLLIAAACVFLSQLLGAPLPAPLLWLLVAAGFAIVSPLALLPLVGAVALGRWLSRIGRARHPLRILLELGTWATLLLVVVSMTWVILEQALFNSQPFEVDSFVSPPLRPDEWDSYGALHWAAYLAGSSEVPLALPAPHVVGIPLLVVRLLWAGWAVALAVWAMREGRLLLAQLAVYWRTAGWRRAAKPAAPAPKGT